MENWDFSDLALELSDLEVALFLCLVAREHCLIETTDDCIHDVAKELALVIPLQIVSDQLLTIFALDMLSHIWSFL